MTSVTLHVSAATTGYALTVTVTDSTTGKTITGARVSLDGVYKGTTNFYGKLIIPGVIRGSHTVTVSKTGYRAAAQGVYVSSSTSITVRLQSLTSAGYTVTVLVRNAATSVAISGASVYLDGIRKGTTDYSGRLVLTGVTRGSHTISVTKTGYKTTTQQTYISGSTSVAVRLQSSTGRCDPAYPTVCIPPPPPDLDCADIPYRRFRVLPPDPHHFDGDGDGIGCEWG
jgi:hypothetical protein